MGLELPALNGHTAVFVAENEKNYTSLLYPRVDFVRNNGYVRYFLSLFCKYL